ncbi:MAG TPA: asparagine synthase (glutamine-hydrolyzing) [Candidatus Binatia bacterium]|nr:asparagine synthase (glutamine-hydrolyzing) [Candidatus Binatia bacterium]
MCGICGVVRFDGAMVEVDALETMMARLAHRGPDDRGLWREGPVGLGHRRLAIIDLAHGRQPMANEDGRVQVVFNGMIYNYRELQQELAARGHRFRTACDTEVLVHGYEEWGVRLLDRLNGMFAFALWDGRQLLAARDRMGEKPLYYARHGGALYFASEIKSILTQVPAGPRIPDDFLVFENTLSDETLFDGVKRLLPGHFLLAQDGGVTVHRYWAPPDRVDAGLGEVAAVRELRDLIVDAIGMRLQAEVPVGMYLSGGLDSSLIACIAKPSVVFTSYYDHPGKFDERAPARRVAEHIGAEQVFVTVRPEEVPSLFAAVVYHLDQPISSPSPISSFALARAARARVTVLLNGQGADELFGGYARYVLLAHEAALGRDPLFVQYAAVARRLWHPSMFGDPALRYLQMNQRVSPRTRRPLDAVRECFDRHHDLIAQMGYTDMILTLPDLITMDDRGCAHVGLESRSPFLDHRVVEFAFRLPGELKLRDGRVTKWILREVAREFVPAEVADRPDKMGMVSPLAVWLRGDLSGWADGLVESLRHRDLGIPFEAPEANDYDRRLHALVSLELWFRTFHDRVAADPQASLEPAGARGPDS